VVVLFSVWNASLYMVYVADIQPSEDERKIQGELPQAEVWMKGAES
jgi:hypothetical protein